MKKIIIIYTLLLSSFVISQNVLVPEEGCSINTISTHPDNYENSSDLDNSQLWDWRTETFTAYYKQTGMGDLGFPASIRSPFFELVSNTNILHFTDAVKKDYENEDGWELLYRNFGSTSKGLDNPYFVLYNRFTGTIRVFVNVRNSGTQNSNAASISLAFDGASMKTAFLNQLGLYTKALDNFDSRALAANNNSYANSGVNDNFYWLSADFNSMYDPCTCGLKSDIKILVALISDTKVDLSINGTITNLLDNTASNQNISSRSPLTSLSQYFDFGNTLISDAQGLFSSANEAHATGVQLQNAAQQFVNSNSNLFGSQPTNIIARQIELILYEVPTIGQWLKFGSTLITTVKKTGQNFKTLSANEKKEYVKNSKVTTQNVNLKLSGNLSQSANYLEATLALPGSNNSEIPEFRRPVYNNILGVFNLAENPRLTLTKYRAPSDLVVPYGDDLISNDGWDIFPDLYKLEVTEPLKPILNPASGLRIVSLEARIEYLNREGPSLGLKGPMKLGDLKYHKDNEFIYGYQGTREDYYESIDANFLLFEKSNFNNPNYKWDRSLFSSDFVGQGCFNGMRLFSWSQMEEIVVKVNVVLTPIDFIPGSEVDKILVVYTYPATVTKVNSPINYQVTGAIHNVVQHKEYSDQNLGIAIQGVPNTISTDYPNNISLSNQIITQNIFAKGNITIGPNVIFNQNNLVIQAMGNIKIQNSPILNHSVGQFLTFKSKETVEVFPEAVLEPSIILEIDNDLLLPCAYEWPVVISNEEIVEFCNSNKYNNLSRPKNKSKSDVFIDNQDSKFDISMYPNPTENFTTILFSYEMKEAEIKVFDITGREVFIDIKKSRKEYSLDLSNLSSGIYQVNIIGDNISVNKTLIKN